ncbi:MAG TPA: hypothetical protein VFM18_14950 [Methanosarcina sp.]|nr:hypothetical protein [Methanosarcina sp.]
MKIEEYEIELILKWFDSNKTYFNLDKFYGVDIITELMTLISDINKFKENAR